MKMEKKPEHIRILDLARRIVSKTKGQLSLKTISLRASHYKTLVVALNQSLIAKYRNPDPRCTYPFDHSPAGYCWSYAHWVDGSSGYAGKPVEDLCKGCDLWKPVKKKKK